MALRDKAQKAAGSGSLRAAVKKATAGTEAPSLKHPTLDSPESSQRQTYIPPMPKDRFQFLRDFSMKPGLRNKASGENTNR